MGDSAHGSPRAETPGALEESTPTPGSPPLTIPVSCLVAGPLQGAGAHLEGFGFAEIVFMFLNLRILTNNLAVLV